MGFDQDYLEASITWERGLIETVEDSMLPPGAAARLRNWIADPSGNLRARIPWLKGSTTGAPATRKGHGIGYFTRQIAPGIVQKSDIASSALGATGGDLAATWLRATTRGNLLILVAGFSLSDGSTTITPPTDFTSAVTSADTSGRPRVGIWYIENAAPRTGAETVTFTGMAAGNSFYVQLFEVSGIALSGALDKTASDTASGDATPQSGTTAATVQAVEFAIAALLDEQAEAQTSPTNSFTQQGFVSGPGDAALGTYSRILSATGAQSVSVTTASADDTAGAIATFKGWFSGTPSAGQLRAGRFVVAQDDTTEFDLFQIDSDDLAAGTFSAVESVAVSSTASLVATAPGFSRMFYTSVDFETARAWDGLTASAVTGAPAGRCIAVHKNRVFIGGTNGDPSVLYYSEVGDFGIWSGGTASFIPVGASDGEPIEDITPVEDGLLIGKQTSLWFLTGSGPDNFRLIRLPAGGVAPGRTLLATPYGAIVAGRKNVWIYSGGSVSLISQPIQDSYGITDDWLTCSFINDHAYVCDQGSGTVWALDFSTNGTWSEEILSSASTEGPACIYNQDDKQLFTPKVATIGSLLNYRLMPGTARAKDFDTLSEVFEAWTPEMWLVGPGEKFSPRYLFLKLRQRGGDAGDTGLTVTPYYDGATGTAQTVTPQAAAGVFWTRLSLNGNQRISSVQLRFSQTLPSTEASVFDIEELILGFNEEQVA